MDYINLGAGASDELDAADFHPVAKSLYAGVGSDAFADSLQPESGVESNGASSHCY
jgi:hypothetical protein